MNEKIRGAERLFLDEKHSIVRQINQAQNKFKFEPVDQLNLASECDIVVDTSSPGSFRNPTWSDKYKAFKRPVILQSGDFPYGTPISPPLRPDPYPSPDNLYRQGDCILCGLVPILAPLLELSRRIKITMHILTQYTEKLHDYTADIRWSSTYNRLDTVEFIRNQLRLLIPDIDFHILGVTQVHGLSHYTITMSIETDEPVSGKILAEFFRDRPRIMVLPKLRETYSLKRHYGEWAKTLGKELKPITLSGLDLESSEKSFRINLTAFLDYKRIAVLPNIDAIRILVRGMSGRESMKITDENQNFIKVD